jgi:hypothetical protein
VRVLSVIVLALVGCGALVFAWGALQNLFGYRDSSVATYLLIGLPCLAAAIAAFVGAYRLLGR